MQGSNAKSSSPPPRPTTLGLGGQHSVQHSFTSFQPLSPEESKGSFSLAKLFQWRRSESIPANLSTRNENVGVPGRGRTPLDGQSLATKSPRLENRRKPLQSSPITKGKNSPKIHKSWSSPLFKRHQGSSPSSQSALGTVSSSKQLPPSYRNLSALFRRLSVVADNSRGGQLSQPYKESDFKQYWMPDETCKECYECGEKFNTFRRRHHCRLCGQIFCYRCCNVEVPGQLMGYTGGLRVCTYCHKIVLTYTQSPDLIRNLEQLQADLKAVTLETELNISSSTSGNSLAVNSRSGVFGSMDDDDAFYQQPASSRKTSTSSSSGSYFDKLVEPSRSSSLMLSTTRRPFDAFGVCTAEADMLKQDSLRELWQQITSSRTGIELQSHRFRLKNYQNCLVASDLVDWLVIHDKVSNRMQAASTGQALLESGWLEPVPQGRDMPIFKDEYALYQPGPVAVKDLPSKLEAKLNFDQDSIHTLPNENTPDDEEEDDTLPQWFKQLAGYESCEELEEPISPFTVKEELPMNISKASKFSSSKLLDLDVTAGVNSEKQSEMSLKVNLQHFGEGNVHDGKDNNSDQSHTVSIITEAPPPPLEQYVYTEGYPISSLRPGNKKAMDTPLLGASNTSPDEGYDGALMAKRIGVARPGSPQPMPLRDDNEERLAISRLHNAHFYHISQLLEQLLLDAGLSLEWKDTILPLVDDISERVHPDVRNDDDMDIRQYVKIKKIPGGTRADCQLISGVVFTKNISHKKMSSTFTNPHILVLCCAIDYQRNENRLASLDPLVLQERNFLKNFVSRVAALRPNVLLVEKTVSRLAQDMLLQHGISLALNVKPEVIERVARCTKADTLRSMEQLSRPRLGTCQLFRVHKFTLKNGETKTLMFLEGCPTELGCTVTLRGGNSFVLSKVKKIIQFLTYVAYNQKLEMAFLMDEFSMPAEPELPRAWHEMVCQGSESTHSDGDKTEETGDATGGGISEPTKDVVKDESDKDTSDNNYAKVFQDALDKLVLSSSFFVKYPLPYLLTTEGSTCAVRSAIPKEIYWSLKLKPENKTRQLAEDDLEEFHLPTPGQRKLSKNIEVLPPHILTSQHLVVGAKEEFIKGVVADFRAQGGRIQLKDNSELSCQRKQSKWARLELDRIDCPAGMKSIPEASLNQSKIKDKEKRENKKDFSRTSPIHFSRKIDCLDPQLHQRIAVLFSSYSSESNNSPRPCISPWAVFMEFYGRNDITLGGFLERYCFRPSYVCPNPNCDVPMVDHVRYFAHGTGSVYIHMKNLESPVPGFQHTILTWSWCKECKQVTPIVPLSDSGWALSFAKYLELRFYADSYRRRASVKPCGHSLHREHYQYFAFANMVASFKYRPIKLYETAIPPRTIWINDDRREASYWLHDVRAMSTRGESVYSSILEKLESLKVEKVNDNQNCDKDSKLLLYAAQLQEEHIRFLEQVQAVQKKVNGFQDLHALSGDEKHPSPPLDKREQLALEYVVSDSLNGLKRILCELVENWNSRLQDFVQTEKKRATKPSPVPPRDGKPVDRRFSLSTNLSGKLTETSAISLDDLIYSLAHNSPQSPLRSSTPSPNVPNTPKTPKETSSPLATHSSPLAGGAKDFLFRPIARTSSLEKDSRTSPDRRKDINLSNNVQDINVNSADVKDSGNERGSISDRDISESKTLTPTTLPASNSAEKASPRDSPFQRPASSGRKSAFVRGHRRVMSSPPLITVSRTASRNPTSNTMEDVMSNIAGNAPSLDRSRSDSDVHAAVGEDTLMNTVSGLPSSLEGSQMLTEDNCTSEEGMDSDATKSQEVTERATFLGSFQAGKKRVLNKALSSDVTDQDGGTSTTDGIPSLKRKDKMKNIISSLLPGTAFQPVPSTFPSHEHHLLPPGEKVLVVVSEKEPSSIIAYALSTKEYHDYLCEIQRAVQTRNMKGVVQDQQQLYYQHQHFDSQSEEIDGDTSKKSTSSSHDEDKVHVNAHESDEDFVNVDMDDVNPPANSDEPFESLSSSDRIEFIEGQEPSTAVPDKHQPRQEGPRVESVKYNNAVRSEGKQSKDVPEGINRLQEGGEGSSGRTKDDVGGDNIDGRMKGGGAVDPNLAEFGFPQLNAGKDTLDYHIKMQFSYTSCRFYCSVYFAEQFRNLRKRIFLEGEERYIRSLAHCVVWRARGGKSGSAFSKSLDDRFVLKQMSRLELQSFLEFAPHYFQYMNKSLNDKRPPLLAKILGVYRIGYKNSLTNATMRQDVVVMENLFYDRKIDKTFDLKGSMRSRYVQSSGGDDVLMDENLLELIREHPIFIRPHSKAVLSKAIHNDTEFLAQQMVMDYSLLVGIDETRSELVIGIIDFIRTFTWDKKLEMYVKSSGILGGQGKMPTVVSPELYRTRFSEAMQRYFLMVPDKWTGLGTDLD